MKAILVMAALTVTGALAQAHGYHHHRHIRAYDSYGYNDPRYNYSNNYAARFGEPEPAYGLDHGCRAPRGVRGWYYVPGCR